MKSTQQNLPVVAHYTTSFLPVTCNWVYPQIVGPRNVRGSVLCHQRENEEVFPLDEVRVSPVRPVTWFGHRRLDHYVRFSHGLLQRLRRLQPSIVHAHFGTDGACIARSTRRLGISLVTSFYGVDLACASGRWWRRRYRYLFRHGARFLCEGPFAQAQLMTLGCPERKCRVIRLGVDLAHFAFKEREQREDPSVRILMASRFREKKGVSFGVRAFAAFVRQFPDAELRIIGDGEERSRIEAVINDAGIANRVTLLGACPYEAYQRELYTADIFVAPSITAADGSTEGGSPVSITEAAASGIPVVASRHADIPEVVMDGKTGLLAEERDVEALAHHLQRLAETPRLRREMGAAARRHIEENFSLQKELQSLEEVYREVLAGT